jgi:hypothetical protein
MTDQHPITPPPELVERWAYILENRTDAEAFTIAAQWGSDMELEACLQLIQHEDNCLAIHIRAARRPKPPSLKEQALQALGPEPLPEADFRTLCAELADALHNAIRVIHHEDGTRHISTAYLALNRARAALAESQPAADGKVAATPDRSLEPIPMSERLPEAEDCDAEGRCWWGRPESEDWSSDWTLATPEAIAEFCEFLSPDVWLPFNALPLPKEVE